jgi:hypothetical protein
MHHVKKDERERLCNLLESALTSPLFTKNESVYIDIARGCSNQLVDGSATIAVREHAAAAWIFRSAA